MLVLPIKTRIFKEGEDLSAFVLNNVKKLKENSVVVVTSKIAALAEKRTLPLPKNEKEKAKIIIAESQWALPTRFVWLTQKDGMIMASAGIDESNADGKIILLPKNSFKIAQIIRQALVKKFRLRRVGVLITDSRTQPLRAGVVGSALGYAGFMGMRDYRGKKDIFGRKFLFSSTNVADCLASAAVLEMGEGSERQPLAVIENPPIEFTSKKLKEKLSIKFADDIYMPLLKNLKIKRAAKL